MPTEVDQRSAAISYEWRTVSAQKAFGGSYAVERGKGAARLRTRSLGVADPRVVST